VATSRRARVRARERDRQWRRLAAWLAPKKASGGVHEVWHALFTLEAIVGTDVVLGALVDDLEKLSTTRLDAKDPNKTGADDNAALLAYASGVLLLRSEKRDPFEKRLEALYQTAVKANVEPGEHTVRGGLDLALHGTGGAKRALASSHWQYWYYYLMVDDAAVHLARLADTWKSEWVPESRILWLAGDEMLPVYTSKKALRQGKRLPNILRDFGMFDDDRIMSLMVDMVGVKGAGDAPHDYFSGHATRLRPKLERLAKGSSAAAVKAKAALGMLT
jgi:hypothetical protein